MCKWWMVDGGGWLVRVGGGVQLYRWRVELVVGGGWKGEVAIGVEWWS